MVSVQIARTLLAVAAVVAVVPVRSYVLPGADQPLPLGYEPVAPGQALPPQDTPEVARAKAEHLAAVQRAVSRTRASAGAVVPLTLSAPAWSSGSTVAPWAGPQQENGPADTFEVAAEKAKHFAAVEAARRRISPDLPAPVQDTPEVAAARAEHLAAVAAAEARNAAEDRNNGIASTTQSTPTRYSNPQFLTKVHASHFADAGFLQPHNHYNSNPVVAAPTYQSPAPTYQSPAPTYQSPAPTYQSPAPTYQSPAPTYQPPSQYLAPVAVPTYRPPAPTYQPPSQYLAPAQVNQGGYYNNIGEDDGQYRGNDEPSSGEYSYSYNDGLSSKSESRTADGITRGSYSYYDANGVLQTVSYEADDVNGFRVYGSNLPQVSPAVAAALGNPDDPAAAVAAASAGSIQDTPEVAAAKQAHLAAYREALQRLQDAENH